MFLITAPLSWLTANRPAQLLLDVAVKWKQFFQGIGSGTGVRSSGEKVVFKAMRQKPADHYCVFDVGANQGQFLALTRQHVGTENFSVHCFEPGGETFSILQHNHQPDDRVTLNNTGLSRASGEAVLHYDEAGSGLASLTKRELGHFNINFEQSESIKLSTVDEYCQAADVDVINLLKIDVEGHELDVLAGAERMFNERKIDVVTFEFGGCNIDTRTYFRDFWLFFDSRNYDVFRITPSGYLFRIAKYRERCEQFRTTNFVAIPRIR